MSQTSHKFKRTYSISVEGVSRGEFEGKTTMENALDDYLKAVVREISGQWKTIKIKLMDNGKQVTY